ASLRPDQGDRGAQEAALTGARPGSVAAGCAPAGRGGPRAPSARRSRPPIPWGMLGRPSPGESMTDAPPAPRNLRLKVLAIAVVLVGLAADLWSKAEMQERLGMHPDRPHASEHEIPVIPGFFKLAGNWNTGVT